jgi:hypothetical protein
MLTDAKIICKRKENQNARCLGLLANLKWSKLFTTSKLSLIKKKPSCKNMEVLIFSWKFNLAQQSVLMPDYWILPNS